HGGGRLVGKIRIPSALGEPVDFGVNLPPIADVQKRDDEVSIKPEEVPELPTLGNSEGPVKEEDEEVVAESTEEVAEKSDTYTQRYL
ncbi:MAG: hypothetical protein OEV22_21410, partial [Deltaproteobacteria bacterium]|nr:hypothetical protein [Deltaproteobacteria bacterium]